MQQEGMVWSGSGWVIVALLAVCLGACTDSRIEQGNNGASGSAVVPMSPADSLAAALTAIDQRIVSDPGNDALYLERALLHERHDSLDRAVADVERAIGLDSLNVDYRIHLGDLHYRRIKMGEARDAFQRAVDLAPASTEAKLRLGEVYMVLRDYSKAMELVNEALRIDPNAARGYFLKGYINMETKDTSRAISSFRTAVEQDPQDYPSYMLLGQLSASRRDRLAEQYYTTAIELRPRSVEAWYGKGLWAQNNGHDSLAIACYDRIKELDPMNPLPWYNIGFIKLEHLNDPQGAKADFSKAIDLNTNYADAWYSRGIAMERTQQPDSAAANYQICLTIDRTHTLAALAVGRLAKQGVRIKMMERKKK